MAFAETVDCCGAARLATLKAQLGAIQNLPGADPANDPAAWDTIHQTLRKMAAALAMTFVDCCRLETNHQLSVFIASAVTPVDLVPANALLDENGNPVLDENGDYILV